MVRMPGSRSSTRPRAIRESAADALSQYVLHNETDYPAHLELAHLRTASGDKAGAADALDRALYIDPYDIAVHQQLADLYQGLGDKAEDHRERRAVVALVAGG